MDARHVIFILMCIVTSCSWLLRETQIAAQIQASQGSPTYIEFPENEVEVPPLGTCRQECAGHNIGCPPGFVCCRTGCGHICQPLRCPKIKLTPYPFCLTHCPSFQTGTTADNKNSLKSFCLCYNACMNVRCGKEEMCVPRPAKCDKGTPCLPLGVCVNVNKYSADEDGVLYLIKDKLITSPNDATAAKRFFDDVTTK